MSEAIQTDFQRAVQLFSQGDASAAERVALTLVQRDSSSPEIWNLLAVIQNRLGNPEGAIAAMENAIKLLPSQPVYHANLGEMYRRRNDLASAIRCARRAVELDPSFQGAYYNLANALKADHQYEEAEKQYRRALELDPRDLQSYQNLGNLYRETERLHEAAASYLLGWRIAPERTEIAYSLAQTYLELKNEVHAEFHFKDLLTRVPDHALALKSLAVLLQNQGRFEEGIDYYRRYIAASAASDDLALAKRLHLEMTAPVMTLSRPEIDRIRARLEERISAYATQGITLPRQALVDENLQAPSQLIYHGRDNRTLKERYARLFSPCFPHAAVSVGQGKIRVGFFVTRDHEGIFAKYMCGVIDGLDPVQFEPWVICEERGWARWIAPRLRRPGVRALWMSSSLDATAAAMRGLGLDILYHWEIGTDPINYFMPFLRLAPVQVTSVGWPDTSGIPTIDHYISSRWTEPPGADRHYSERLVRFDRLPLHHERPTLEGAPVAAETLGLERAGHHVYFCAQNLRKLHPDQDELVGAILRRDPKGVAVFVQHESDGITRQFKLRLAVSQADVADRVLVLRRLSYREYLSMLHHADVVLDSVHFGGANTTYEAFAMHRPVVTLPGTHARGRYTAGCYAAMGIEGCVAEDAAAYVEIAVRLATDPLWRSSILRQIEEKSPCLFADPGLLAEYAAFFRRVAGR